MTTEKTMDTGNDTGFKIGAGVKAWRRKRNLLQKELAARTGMNVTQLWSIENDRNSPSMRTVARIASALGITVPQLLSAPDGDAPDGSGRLQPAEAGNGSVGRGAMRAGGIDLVPVMRKDGKGGILPQASLKELSAKAEEALALDSKFHTSMPATLPLSLPIAKSEAGARQLAFALRAHCNLGAAILHDALAAFEPYGIRILEAELPQDGDPAAAFYCPQHRNFTVFLSPALRGEQARSRRQFTFISEIGKMFLFARNGFKTYRETKVGRRFIHHFAATFLLPETTVVTLSNSLNIGRSDWTWDLLLRIKQRFGVSAQVFNIRLKEIGLISRKLHEIFDKKIKAYYRANNYAEPMLQMDELSYRAGDFAARGVRRDSMPRRRRR